MAKAYGVIGYSITEETIPGVWEEVIKEYPYKGDLIRNNRKLDSSDRVNDDITISNQISILADPYANANFHAIRYVSFMGTKWKVTSVEVLYPRLTLGLGGVYNGQ